MIYYRAGGMGSGMRESRGYKTALLILPLMVDISVNAGSTTPVRRIEVRIIVAPLNDKNIVYLSATSHRPFESLLS